MRGGGEKAEISGRIENRIKREQREQKIVYSREAERRKEKYQGEKKREQRENRERAEKSRKEK